jgi:hypothetical protein
MAVSLGGGVKEARIIVGGGSKSTAIPGENTGKSMNSFAVL